MRQSTVSPLWILLFVVTLVGTCIVAIRFAYGQGPIASLLGLLAGDCILTSQIFKRATILLWIIALVLVTIAFFTALYGIKG